MELEQGAAPPVPGLGRRATWRSNGRFYRAGAEPPSYPQRMYLESTNVCNLAASCARWAASRAAQEGLSGLGPLPQVVDEMAPHVTATTLHIWGEPLLAPAHRRHDRLLPRNAGCTPRSRPTPCS